MATSKSGSKASTAKKSTEKKSTRSTSTKVTTKAEATAPAKRSIFKKSSGEPNYPAIILAEIVGTFTLTLVALLSLSILGALYVGLTVAVLVLAVGAVSGAHLNPAVTFGLWSARKLKTILVPVYWLAQFVGAILAILALGAFSGSGYPLDFSHFGAFHWGIFSVEILGTAIFLFGLVAAVSNDKLSSTGKAFGVGLSLTIAILVSTSALTTLQTGKDEAYQKAQQEAVTARSQEKVERPGELNIQGATLNPAIALAATEFTENQNNRLPAATDELKHSRLTAEVILGTLIGAALGANLYLLIAYAQRQQS